MRRRGHDHAESQRIATLAQIERRRQGSDARQRQRAILDALLDGVGDSEDARGFACVERACVGTIEQRHLVPLEPCLDRAEASHGDVVALVAVAHVRGCRREKPLIGFSCEPDIVEHAASPQVAVALGASLVAVNGERAAADIDRAGARARRGTARAGLRRGRGHRGQE